MALVIPPPTGIPNALNPTTAAVERDAEKREITPAVTPDSASASTSDSTAEKDLLNYNPKKNDPDRKKKNHQAPANLTASDDDADAVVLEYAASDVDTTDAGFSPFTLPINMADPPETIIAEALLLRQSILAKKKLSIDDRRQLAEINHTIKMALADLLRLKELDEVKALATQLPSAAGVLKGAPAHSHVVSLDDLFACSFDDDLTMATDPVSAKSKLAGAVVGYFYGENIEPQPPSQIDHQE